MKYGEAALVEARGVGAAEQRRATGDLRLRDVRVDRIGRRREVVRGVAAHLVQVDDDLRVARRAPILIAPARLGLRLREPVAVHVEQVVIGAAARPRLVVLGGQRVGIGHRPRGPQLVLAMKRARPSGFCIGSISTSASRAIGVDAGSSTRGQQVIGLGERGIATRRSRCRARRASARRRPAARATRRSASEPMRACADRRGAAGRP